MASRRSRRILSSDFPDLPCNLQSDAVGGEFVADAKRVKREPPMHELGTYRLLHQEALGESFSISEFISSYKQFFGLRTVCTTDSSQGSTSTQQLGNASISMPALALSSLEAFPGASTILVEAVNEHVAARQWHEVLALLRQVQHWHSVCHMTGAERPWWVLSSIAHNRLGVGFASEHVDLASVEDAEKAPGGAQAPITVEDNADACEAVADLVKATQRAID